MEVKKCGLCKLNNATHGMSMKLNDVNGSMVVDLCQVCLKKLKTAVRNPKPMTVDIYPKDGK